MAQYARPDGDVSNAGAWTTEPLWSSLDDNTDSEYISTPKSAASVECELQLSNVTDPVSSTGHVLRIRAYSTSSSGGSVGYYLYETGSARGGSSTGTLTASWATYSYTLSAAEANAITNYNNLTVILTGTAASNKYTRVAWVELEVPDAPQSATAIQGIQTVRVSQLAPTVSLRKTVTISSTQSVPVSQLAPTIRAGVRPTQAIQTVTVSPRTPTVLTTGGATVAQSTQTVLVNTIAPTILATRSATATQSTQTVRTNTLPVTISATTSTTAQAAIQSILTSLREVSVLTTRSTTALAGINQSRIALLNPTIDAGGPAALSVGPHVSVTVVCGW